MSEAVEALLGPASGSTKGEAEVEATGDEARGGPGGDSEAMAVTIEPVREL